MDTNEALVKVPVRNGAALCASCNSPEVYIDMVGTGIGDGLRVSATGNYDYEWAQKAPNQELWATWYETDIDLAAKVLRCAKCGHTVKWDNIAFEIEGGD